MELNKIKPAEGAKHSKRRVGRGIGSGLGKTAGRGHKGQKSRSGGFHKVGFEGGQMPLYRRLPKRGFKNINRISYKVLNLEQIDAIIDRYQMEEISFETLYTVKLLNRNDLIKILGKGELKSKVSFKVNAVSETAKSAIEAAGGTLEII